MILLYVFDKHSRVPIQCKKLSEVKKLSEASETKSKTWPIENFLQIASEKFQAG